MIKFFAIAGLTLFIAGCAVTQNGQKTLYLTNSEASQESIRFKKEFDLRKDDILNNINNSFKFNYIQPENKISSCKLPVDKELLEEIDNRHFWDGSCKNGYAAGFGRQIYISNSNHIEKIVDYDVNSFPRKEIYVQRNFSTRTTARGAIEFDENKRVALHYGVTETLGENQFGDAITTFTASYNIPNKFLRFERNWDASNLAFVEIAFKDGAGHTHLHFNLPYRNQFTDFWFITDKPINIENPPDNIPIRVRQISGEVTDVIFKNRTPYKLQLESNIEYWNETNRLLTELQDKLVIALKAANEAGALENRYDSKLKSGFLKTPKGLSKKQYTAKLDYYTEFTKKQRETIARLHQKIKEQQENLRNQNLYQAQINTLNAQQRAAMASEAAAYESMIPKSVQTNCYQFGSQTQCFSW